MLPSKTKVYSIFLFCHPHYAVQFSSMLQDFDRSNKYIFIQSSKAKNNNNNNKRPDIFKGKENFPKSHKSRLSLTFHWPALGDTFFSKTATSREFTWLDWRKRNKFLWCYKTIHLAYGRMRIDEKWTSWKVIYPYISKHGFFILFYTKININYTSQFTGLEALLCIVWCWNTMDKPGDIVSIFQT